MIRIKIVIYFIYYSLLQGIHPWRFFQINADYFNEQKWIFSKYEIEKNIPTKWKLNDYILNLNDSKSKWEEKITSNFSFPLFLKPEWGQNSHGIFRVDEKKYLKEVLKKIKKLDTPYICQELANYEKEYEVLYVRSKNQIGSFSIFSITETINTSWEKHAIQWINHGSKYRDITNKFSKEELKEIENKAKTIWNFNLARVWIKANNPKWILKWDFKVFEINIFVPFSLNLLDETISKENRHEFLKSFVKALAHTTKKVTNKKPKNIFWRMTIRHYMIKLNWNNIW